MTSRTELRDGREYRVVTVEADPETSREAARRRTLRDRFLWATYRQDWNRATLGHATRVA